ncbi:PIR Superfamily Protein [Plasmodium ovale curtisi]|uniref:PIR Superfamily Protein n=1 Tax=Plasmodium ovale curtisi TaxID=864141 RepID=A0A1A8X932_PLAOA|nr:PIR Superfamily Protein [Plasmodium ovale curtisi]SBT01751.1 PIR Superfamily Protein [Plasmodium ovale curtisi]
MPAANSQEGSTVFFGNSSKELYTKQFYEDIDRESTDLSKYSKQCEKIYVNSNKNEVKKICEKFLKHLETSSVWKVVNPKYDVCMLLNYWIYDKLTDIYKGQNSSYDINIAFGSLQGVWHERYYYSSNISHQNKCKPNFEMVNHHDWKERKELHDYCINYEFIEPMCKYFSDQCIEHCEYIEAKSHIYKHFEQLCTPGESKCPHFYKKCKAYNPNIVLKTLKCPEKSETSGDDTPKASSSHNPSEQGQDDGPGAPGSELAIFPPGSDTVSTADNSNIGTKIGHTVLGIAPVLLSATALYRYTPVGSWIRKLGGYNPNSMSDMNTGEIDEFSSYTQEPGDMLFGGTENYISYQPM